MTTQSCAVFGLQNESLVVTVLKNATANAVGYAFLIRISWYIGVYKDIVIAKKLRPAAGYAQQNASGLPPYA